MNVTLQVKKSNAESQVQLVLILVSTPKLTRLLQEVFIISQIILGTQFVLSF